MPEPEREPRQGRLPPPRGVVEEDRDGEDEQAEPDGPAQDVPPVLGAVGPAVVVDHRLAERAAADDHHEADADGHGEHRGQHRRAAVLGERPCGRAGCRRCGWRRARPAPSRWSSTAARSRGRARAPPRRPSRTRRTSRPPRRGRRCSPAPGDSESTTCATTAAGRSSSRSAASPVRASRNGHDGQAGLQGERARVGEAVAVAEPHERLHRDRPQPVAAGEVPRVEGVELVTVHLGGDGDGARGRHGRTLGPAAARSSSATADSTAGRESISAATSRHRSAIAASARAEATPRDVGGGGRGGVERGGDAELLGAERVVRLVGAQREQHGRQPVGERGHQAAGAAVRDDQVRPRPAPRPAAGTARPGRGPESAPNAAGSRSRPTVTTTSASRSATPASSRSKRSPDVLLKIVPSVT